MPTDGGDPSVAKSAEGRLRRWWRRVGPVTLALLAAVGTFAAIATSLYLPKGEPPSRAQLAWSLLASAVAGLLALLQRQARSEHGEPAATPLVAASTPTPLFYLPPDIGDFTGRDTPVTRIVGLLSGEQRLQPTAVTIVAISGPAGVGKTALAVHAGHMLAPHFPDGQLYINLRGAEPQRLDPAEVLAELLRSLGVPGPAIPLGLEDRQQLYRRHLADRHALLVLDNAANETQVRPLLPSRSSCAVLISSRQRLSALEGAQIIDLDVLGSDDTVRLLGLVVGEARVQQERAAAAEIARLCGYLPLAIRIAGARLAARRHWRLAQLVERLRDEHRRLDELKIGDREVRAALALSYEGRSEPERRLFRLLGLLRAEDFAAWVAAALLQVPLVEAEDLLERLVDAQLLEAIGDAAGMARYRFHDLLRVYARERLDEEEPAIEQRAALERALGAYLELAMLAGGLTEPGGAHAADDAVATRPAGDTATASAVTREPVAWLTMERASLVAAVERAHEAGMWSLVWDLANTLLAFLELQANWTDWQHVLRLALDAARRAGNRQQEASALLSLGRLSWDQDRWDEATRLGTATASTRHCAAMTRACRSCANSVTAAGRRSRCAAWPRRTAGSAASMRAQPRSVTARERSASCATAARRPSRCSVSARPSGHGASHRRPSTATAAAFPPSATSVSGSGRPERWLLWVWRWKQAASRSRHWPCGGTRCQCWTRSACQRRPRCRHGYGRETALGPGETAHEERPLIRTRPSSSH